MGFKKIILSLFSFLVYSSIYSQTAEEYLSKANEERKNKHFENAIALYKNVILLDSSSFPAYFYSGFSYSMLGKDSISIGYYNKAIATKGDDAEAYYQRGYSYFEINKYPEAILDFRKAASFRTADMYVPYFTIGNAYQTMAAKSDRDEYDKIAIQYYDSCLTINPTYEMAILNKGVSYYHLDKNRKALKLYNKAAILDPKDTLIHYNKGNVYSGMKKYKKAILEYTIAMKELTYEDYPEKIYLYIGECYLAVKKGTQACYYLSRSAALGNKIAIRMSKANCF